MQVIPVRYFSRMAATFVSACLIGWPALSAETSTIPDLSGTWGRNSPDFDAPSSGPVPVANIMRLPNGASNPSVLVGDFKNPILKPAAADIVKRYGEMSLSGKAFSDPSSDCWPYQPPYDHTYQFHLQILQQKDEVIIIYDRDSQVRRVRMNQPHPANVTPSWMGDSVGHYEGDTLVVDTVGIKVGRHSMVDRYGTPFSPALHVIERFRLIDGQAAKAAVEQSEKKNFRFRWVDLDPGPQDKGLQIQFTVEDDGVFTTPWSASVTHLRSNGKWLESVCAENPNPLNGVADVPIADKADF